MTLKIAKDLAVRKLKPEGAYECVCMKGEATVDKFKRPQVVVQAVLTNGDGKEYKHMDFITMPGQHTDEDGSFLKDDNNVVLDARDTWWRIEALWRAFGVKIKKDKEGNVLLNPADLEGRKCTAQVVHRVWEEKNGGDGQKRENVNYKKAK